MGDITISKCVDDCVDLASKFCDTQPNETIKKECRWACNDLQKNWNSHYEYNGEMAFKVTVARNGCSDLKYGLKQYQLRKPEFYQEKPAPQTTIVPLIVVGAILFITMVCPPAGAAAAVIMSPQQELQYF